MIRKYFFCFWALFFFLGAGVIWAASDSWTGYVFLNGNNMQPEEGGPFKTEEECVSWGKTKAWHANDQYQCGQNCEKDADGNLICAGSVTAERKEATGSFTQNTKTSEAPKSSSSASQPRVLVS